MFKVLFAKEILENFATRRFLMVCLLCLIVIPLGVYVGTRDYQLRLHAYQESVRIYGEDHKAVRDILYRGGAKGFRPPSALGFLSQGLDIVLPNIAESPGRLEKAPVDLRLNNNQSFENLYASFHGPLDLVFIVSVIMTFLAIVFSFGAVSGEKEQGTLRQILCNSVPRHQIILAKMTANFLALVIPFVAALALSLLIFFVHGFSFAGPDSALTATVLALILSFLVIGVFFNLGLLVSSLTRQAVSSFIILLLCWVFLFGVYPRLGVVISQLVYPVKSQQLVLLERNQIRLENDKSLSAAIDKIVESSNNTQERQDEATRDFRAKLTDRLQKLDRDLENRRNTQMRIAVNLSRLSPVSCFVRPMAEVSRTGWMKYQQFNQDLGRFRSLLNDQVFGKYYEFQVQKGGFSTGFKGEGTAPAPTFQTTRIRTEDVLKNILPDAVLLVVFNILFFAAAFVVFLKYDVR
jgi:ABC-type transport system involved in multi-copper enzyme maturation permease subunit